MSLLLGRSSLTALGWLFATSLVFLLVLPVLALVLSSSPADVRAGLSHPLFASALWLSLRTTLISLACIAVLGTPLAWWLASSASKLARVTAVLIDVPIVIPPAVVGVALLQTFGQRGLLGPALASVNIRVPFTESAVILAQLIVAAPFFVQAASNAFRKVEPDLLIVARTLGASPSTAFFRIAVPIALPGLVVGASLAWARALGEFGATLLFAGNMPGKTQTMPLAIYSALEADVHLAVTFSLALVGISVLLLGGIRVALAEGVRRSE